MRYPCDTISHRKEINVSILNFGSCCIDNVYSVPHFAAPGETLPCLNYEIHPGGKGLNQSIALAACDADVHHAGRVGEDGRWLIELLESKNIKTDLMQIDDGPSGHANIQVTPEGENSIVLFGGANQKVSHEDIDKSLAAGNHEFLLIQNEISSLDYLIEQAADRGMKIAFNAAPMTSAVHHLPLDLIHLLIINELEGAALTGEGNPNNIITTLLARFPSMRVLLTLGEQGACYADSSGIQKQPAEQVNAVDTTGAGDTFTGYFVAEYANDRPIEEVLKIASRAAALSVTRPGAASSIPHKKEITSEL